MLPLKLSKDLSKRSKAEKKGKKEKKLNDEDVCLVSLFTGDGSKTDKGGSR